MFEKHVGEIFRELMRSFLQKYRMVFCKNTDMWIPEILRGLLQKFSGVEILRSSVEIFRSVLQKGLLLTGLLQKGVLQKYWYAVCRNMDTSSAKKFWDVEILTSSAEIPRGVL